MRRRKKTFWKPVVVGFGVMYALTMGLATYLVKEKFTDDYERRFEEATGYIIREALDREFSMEEEGWESEQDRKDFYQSLANDYLWRTGSEDLQISLGFYDRDKRLMAQTRNEIGGGSIWEGSTKIRESASYGLDEILSQEEKEQLIGYQWKNVKHASLEYPDEYRFSMRTSPGGEELWEIYVQKITWTDEEEYDGPGYEDPLLNIHYSWEMGVMISYETGEEIGDTKSFLETDSEIVWQWTNPNISEELLGDGRLTSTWLQIPYMSAYMVGAEKGWERWNRSEYLHDFPEEEIFSWEGLVEEPPLEIDSDGFYYRGKYKLQVGMAGDPSAYMEIRMEASPWAAAVDYMKYVYMAGLMLTLVCMIKNIYAFRKIYDKQIALEETRRDFTNAIAHELKNPLGIIRNFAENLLEHNMEDKRDYYLSQIIGQTEEMDRLVVKMIELSKLDSDELVLGEEMVAFSELFKEQTARFDPMIQEKKIQVRIQTKGEFAVKGDKEYLEKAVWNLLCNGVDYNVDGGRIDIKIEKDWCAVENTGVPMKEEELARAFELFYTGDKSRSKKEGHMGMGLFLAKKILKLHGLSLTLENMEDGVRAVIKK